MSADYEIFDAVNLKYVRIDGFTHLKELLALAERYRADPRFSNRRQLVDLTLLTDARAGFRDVLTLRNFYLRQFGPVETPIPVALAAPTDLGYGIARMFTMLMVGNGLMNIRIFNDLSSACEWFNLSIERAGGHIGFVDTTQQPS